MFLTEGCEEWVGLGEAVNGPLWLAVPNEDDVHGGRVAGRYFHELPQDEPKAALRRPRFGLRREVRKASCLTTVSSKPESDLRGFSGFL